MTPRDVHFEPLREANHPILQRWLATVRVDLPAW